MATRFTLLSLFPDYFSSPLQQSMLRRAQEGGLISVDLVDIRDHAKGRHRVVDDRPFGGGPGMLLMAEPVAAALRCCKEESEFSPRTIYLSPQGRPLTPQIAEELAAFDHLIFLCGHYEGVDQRVIDAEVDEEISIGDYVLTSGCPAALVLLDAVCRFIPGVLGHDEAARKDSFQEGPLLEGPHYTRPQVWEGREVPAVLLGGNHQEIDAWRKEQAEEKTKSVRPDLFGSS